MNNAIYIRIGRPKRFREEPKPPGPIKTFLIKWGIVIGTIYFTYRLLKYLYF